MAARSVGGAPDRDSLSTREANGATVLMEEDTAAVTKLLLVWLVVEVREIVGRLLVSDEVEQPQELAMNAARGGHARGQERQRPIAVVRHQHSSVTVSLQWTVRHVVLHLQSFSRKLPVFVSDDLMTDRFSESADDRVS